MHHTGRRRTSLEVLAFSVLLSACFSVDDAMPDDGSTGLHQGSSSTGASTLSGFSTTAGTSLPSTSAGDSDTSVETSSASDATEGTEGTEGSTLAGTDTESDDADECLGGDSRPCALGGWKGTCAGGLQTCSAEGRWESHCSIDAMTQDSCEAGNDDDCNGVANEGCPCIENESRACSLGGYLGPCATGTQSCGPDGEWAPCDIAPADRDGCTPGNDDNCNGVPNEDCLCLEGQATRSCGECNDGLETCTNGATGEYGPCEGAVLEVQFYYEDLDGDGYGGRELRVCEGDPPEGAIARGGDCYDENADARPGQTEFFFEDRGDGSYDYDCDGETEHEREAPIDRGPVSCEGSGSCNDASDCASPEREMLTTVLACGANVSYRVCYCGGGGCGSTGTGLVQGCR